MLLSPKSYHKYIKWFDEHHLRGGSIRYITLEWDQITHPGNYVNQLFDDYRKIPFEKILEFSESEITDNSMPDREIMEDASKIHMLRNIIRNKNLIFTPQILFEPWHNRWRIHPGSGRSAAMWLEGYKNISGIYVHFNETVFKEAENVGEALSENFLDKIYMHKRVIPDFEYYYAFPKTNNDCLRTYNMDREWQWHHIKTYRPWKFIRWSEGKDFLKHKYNWRSYAMDLWHELQ